MAENLGPNGLPYGQLSTVEGAQNFLIGPDGSPVIVGASEVSSLLGAGYSTPNADQQAWVQNELASRNPSFYPSIDYTSWVAGQSGGGGKQGGGDDTGHDYRAEARLLFPWIPEPLLGVFADAWAQYGDPALAMGALRQDPRYEQYFPGNRREDGSLRATEAEYLATMDGYDRRLQMFGLDPGDFQAKKISAFQNGRSPQEVEADIGRVYVGIATRGDEYRSYYAQTYGGGNLSNTALLGSALDPSVSPFEFERRIAASQIGGAAKTFGFDLVRQEAERLQAFGLEDHAAMQLFGKARQELPTLNALATRFADPGDPLTAADYADALVIGSPDELQQLGRLYARNTSQFTAQGAFGPADRSGAQRGLLSR